MSFSRPIQCYHSHADPIWPDSTFKKSSETDFSIIPKQKKKHGNRVPIRYVFRENLNIKFYSKHIIFSSNMEQTIHYFTAIFL
jgi:hypothetical protein